MILFICGISQKLQGQAEIAHQTDIGYPVAVYFGRIDIDPHEDNARAIRAYEKVGFKPVGIRRRYERGDDGTWHDNLLMDLVPEELMPASACYRDA